MPETGGKLPLFRIPKGGHVSHFHELCPDWPTADYYEQDKPLWWGTVCAECGRLTDAEVRKEP